MCQKTEPKIRFSLVVIKHGNLPGEQIMEGECDYCSCIVNIKQMDADEGPLGTGEKLYTHVVPCPTVGCGRDILLKGTGKFKSS